jgi:hypothetical protein
MPKILTQEGILTEDDVIRLLQQEVDKADSQSDWARKTGIDLTIVNNVLRRRRSLPKVIVKALNLENVYRLKQKVVAEQNGKKLRPEVRKLTGVEVTDSKKLDPTWMPASRPSREQESK